MHANQKSFGPKLVFYMVVYVWSSENITLQTETRLLCVECFVKPHQSSVLNPQGATKSWFCHDASAEQPSHAIMALMWSIIGTNLLLSAHERRLRKKPSHRKSSRNSCSVDKLHWTKIRSIEHILPQDQLANSCPIFVRAKVSSPEKRLKVSLPAACSVDTKKILDSLADAHSLSRSPCPSNLSLEWTTKRSLHRSFQVQIAPNLNSFQVA